MKLIENNIQKIVALCKKYKVNKLFVFGSILTDRFNDDSDVDLVVSFNKAEVSDYFDNYFDFKYSLEELLGRDVDLLEEQTIKNPYLKKNVDATKALIYGWFNKETPARYSDAIEEVESFFGDKPKLFEDFYSNLCLRRAIERNIEIIGEAMNRILKADKNIAITNSRKIVDARNYIIHGYDSLSADILWSMVVNHLPRLKDEVTALLANEWYAYWYWFSYQDNALI